MPARKRVSHELESGVAGVPGLAAGEEQSKRKSERQWEFRVKGLFIEEIWYWERRLHRWRPCLRWRWRRRRIYLWWRIRHRTECCGPNGRGVEKEPGGGEL